MMAGLRARKKQRTREAIQREALRLFQERGYDATTIEQIAEAADISPSTFFNYFPTKEDVVLSDPYDPMMMALFRARPADEQLSVMIRRALSEDMAGVFERDRDLILARARVGLAVPAVRARMWAEVERGQELLIGVLAERTGRDRDDFELRVAATVVTSALYTAVLEWVRLDGREDFPGLIGRALDVVDAGARLERLQPER